MACRVPLASRVAFLALLTGSAAAAGDLETELGRNESRVYAAPFVIPAGARVADLALPERLERLGYRRVHDRPDAAGEYFHGSEVFWVFRRSCHAFGADRPAALVGLDLGRGGTVVGVRLPDGSRRALDEPGDAWLEPELLAESLGERRAVRTRIALDSLPERVWRPVLAAEDARFFEHTGVDPRAVARAALRNLMAGRVAQGGSTITQQLIKNRDLGPERTLGRKASEAMRALALEAAYDKREILQAYLNSVYLGHVDGLAVHGIGTAARVYFSKPATSLSLAEAAALAAMIQGPNRLSPTGAASALRTRRDWVLSRMAELGWASKDEAARAKAQGLGAKISAPRAPGAPQFVAWVAQEVSAENAGGRGYLVETTLDPWLQRLAERAVAARLEALRKSYPRQRAELQAALVALDGRTGEVLAYVGGDPAAPGFDRVRSAKRQPGSVVKPFVALEAIERCGRRDPLTASSRIADEPLAIDLPSGNWRPENFDHQFHGPVLLREALAESRNVPSVRIARWCGFDSTAETFARAGFALPRDPPPAFVLGAVESNPLQVASAYTVFSTLGRVLEPFPVRRVETSGGRGIDRRGAESRRVASAESTFIVRDLLRTAVERGTAAAGEIPGFDVAAKTGSSSELRDAWFAGQAGSVVTAVWVGLDGGGRLGLTGAQAAGPIWHDFMSAAAPARAPLLLERPDGLLVRWVQTETGLLTGPHREGSRQELYRKGTLPSRRRWWRADRPMPVIE